MKADTSNTNPNTREAWNAAFAEDGSWRLNLGRDQTRRFAECFHKHVRVPITGKFSVLDVGCALGDSLPVWRKHYPEAELHGTDVSEVAIEQARELHGAIATFTRASFDEITGTYDVIFCSNVLEHFEEHVAIARKLLAHCRYLYVLTPYAEWDEIGRPLVPAPNQQHVATFFLDTFDSLRQDDFARIDTKIVRCPIAWSPSLKGEIGWHLRYFLGRISTPSPPRRQIIYTITATLVGT
jgi:SAM-dependent methyltransferase